MNFANIRIVLVATSHPGNIGAAARALKTMGFSTLYLVNPKFFPDPKALEMAASANDVLTRAIVTQSLAEAIADCHFVIATSARPRHMGITNLTPAECAKVVDNKAQDAKIAIVFGREQSGLTNQELLQCHVHVTIPSNPDYSSLNLAQSVQIITYELRMVSLALSLKPTSVKSNELASVDEVEQFYQQLSLLAQAVDFLKPMYPRPLMARVRRLFNRAQLEKIEVNILRGIISHVFKALNEVNKKLK